MDALLQIILLLELLRVVVLAASGWKFGTITWDTADTAYTSWWCSNGLYKKGYGAAAGTVAANGLSNLV